MKLAAFVIALGACAREPAPPAPELAHDPVVAPPAHVAPPAVATPVAPHDDAAVALAAVRQRGHDALSRDCGECHESHRPTAKPPALAIFDLDKSDWLSKFDERRFSVALQRFNAKPAADRDAFAALRDAELAARRR